MLGRYTVVYSHRAHGMSTDGCQALPQAESNVHNGPSAVNPTADASAEVEETTCHPLFRQHPMTGRVALFTAPMFMVAVKDGDGHALPSSEGHALVARLLHLAVRGAYQHHFEKNDLVLFDNRCMLHSATPMPSLPPPGRRLMHRIRMSSTELPLAPRL